jgi:hypothetical protein
MNGEYNCDFMATDKEGTEWCAKNGMCHNQHRNADWKLLVVSKPKKKNIKKEITKYWDDADISDTFNSHFEITESKEKSI